MKIKQFIKLTALKCRKNAPTIYLVAGIVGVVTSTVLACKATTKLSGVLEEDKRSIKDIKDALEKNTDNVYSEEDASNDTVITHSKTVVSIAKLYAIPVLLGAFSITSLITANSILKKRNAITVAAYTALNTQYKRYRKNVVTKYGEEVDKQLQYGETVTITKTVVNPITKETETSEIAVPVISGLEERSPYARFFDESNVNFIPDSSHNHYFLSMAERIANDRLRTQGYLFLNDVYEDLGISKTPEGQLAGWIYTDDENEEGDNYIDFGISDIVRLLDNDEQTQSIILDFNVDGVILDRI